MIGMITLFPLAEVQMLIPPASVNTAGSGTELILLGLLLACVLAFLLRPNRRRRGQSNRRDRRPARRGRTFGSNRSKNWILVDGSNVMHWADNTPHLEPLTRVIRALKTQGFDPGVVFDANAGWKLMGRFLGERELSQLLGLPQDQILVVPKGSPADPWLLTTARDFGARIVTNDRYRDWAGDHPEISEPGFLVRGGLTEGKVWLEGIGTTPTSAMH